jgi:cadmium resistance protein CadD (predicted permease)
VNRYVEVLSASLATFAATNIDDAFLLTFFFARRIPPRRIIVGQYIGFAIIVVAGLVCSWAALAISDRWIRFLGLLPIALGIKHLFHKPRMESGQQSTEDFSVLSIALLTMSNGADNIGVYVPFFIVGRNSLWLILVVYALLVGVWCFFGRWLGTRSVLLRLVDRWADRAVPIILISLGAYVFYSA